jgi:nucleoside-diphosphate-sugar epimerase
LREGDEQRPGHYVYTESKQKAERAVINSGVRSGIARFVNVYGPGDRHFSRIVPGTIRRLLRRQPIRLTRGDGTTVLDYLFVQDAVEALVSLAGFVQHGVSTSPAVFNFGVGAEHALDVVHLIGKVSHAFDGCERAIEFPQTTSEPRMVKFLDSTKATSVLGWRAKTLLDDGLSPTVDWYRRHISTVRHFEDEPLATSATPWAV